jgi:hypothetical protein
MSEFVVEGEQDAKESPDSVSERYKWDSDNEVGRYAASLTEIVNKAMEPKEPADNVSTIDMPHQKLSGCMQTYKARALDRPLRMLTRTLRHPPTAVGGDCLQRLGS